MSRFISTHRPQSAERLIISISDNKFNSAIKLNLPINSTIHGLVRIYIVA